MQHVDRYCRSAKSYAAHLTRLCCGLEHRGDPALMAAIGRWLDGKVVIARPPTLADRGRMTIADLGAARDAQDARARAHLVHMWAQDV